MPNRRENPYVGMDAFTEGDQEYFFGRDRETRQLTSLVMAHRVVLFYAQSGAGKTSLLQASVIPKLRKMAVLPIARVGGDLPPGVELGKEDNFYAFNALYKLAGEGADAGALARAGLVEGLKPYLDLPLGEGRPRRWLLVLDQFEELFTSHPEGHPQWAHGQRAGFFGQLQECLASYPQLALLLAMREDFIAHLDFYAALLPDRLRTRYRMERLNQDQAKDAVIKPAEQVNRHFELEAAQKLVDDLRRIQLGIVSEGAESKETPRGEYVEPLHLQLVCQRLWDQLQPPRDSWIREEDVVGSGDVDQILRELYEESLLNVLEAVEDNGCDERQLRDWFDERLITPAGTRGLVFRDREKAETAGVPDAAAKALSEKYIIRRVPRGGDDWYELAHDRLVEPIRQANRTWRQARQAAAPWLRQAPKWKESGKPDDLLLSGEHLARAQRWRQEGAKNLAPHEEEFLERSREARLAAAPWLHQAESWHQRGEPDDGFLGAVSLEEAVVWAERHQQELAPHEERFIKRSQEALEQAERQRARERGTNLADRGWGVVFAFEDRGRISELKGALYPLLQWRRDQAGERYREFVDGDGYRPNDTAETFLIRHGAGVGTADPDKVPYYLLLVGDPETIPFEFQYALDVYHAVGRICFDDLQEYTLYARSVVAAERGEVALPRQLAFFGVQNRGDRPSTLSTQGLLKPLADRLARDRSGWKIQVFLPEEAQAAQTDRRLGLGESVMLRADGGATKAQLARLLGGDQTPAILFSTSNGMRFRLGHPLQVSNQGALLCQDWTAPYDWTEEISQDNYLSGRDIPDDARLLGLVAFLWASFSAGTPRLDDFPPRGLRGERPSIAQRSFLARLPQRMLAHPQGGALAVVSHVERVWGYSFLTKGAGAQLSVFQEALQRLMDGHTVGLAMERFNLQYALLSSVLVEELQRIEFGKATDPVALAEQWERTIDARNYVILGDPAARLPLADQDAAATERPILTLPGKVSSYSVQRLTEAVRGLAARLGQAVEASGDLEVTTYVGDELRARTHITPNGDTSIMVPTQRDGTDELHIDEMSWRVHRDAERLAMTHRGAMVEATISVITEVLQEQGEESSTGRR